MVMGATTLSMRAARSLEIHIKGRTFAVFSTSEDWSGVVFWGHPDECDVERIILAFETDIAPSPRPHASLLDLRHLESMDLGLCDKLSSHLAPRSGRIGQVVSCQALLLRRGAPGPSIVAFCSAISANPLAQSFTDPVAALAWIGVYDLTVLDSLESLCGDASADPPVLAALRAHLDKNSAIRVNDLARQLAVSPRSLQRQLRESGTSFRREATQARLRFAKRLLRDKDYSIKAIALECGCASPQHFSVFFRQHEGVSPSGWRSGQRAE